MQGVQRIVAGDSLSFLTTVTRYPATDGWELHFALVPRFTTPTQATIELTATAEGEDFRTEVAPTTSAAWAPGEYGWRSWVQRTGERISLEAGQLTILPDPAQATQGLDTRTDAAIALANVRAVIKGVASKNVLSYTINGRSLEHYSIPDLIALESKLARDVAREENAAGMAMGLKSRRRVMVRCSNA